MLEWGGIGDGDAGEQSAGAGTGSGRVEAGWGRGDVIRSSPRKGSVMWSINAGLTRPPVCFVFCHRWLQGPSEGVLPQENVSR